MTDLTTAVEAIREAMDESPNKEWYVPCNPSDLRLILDALEKAEKTLRLAGYTDEGGELWKPPLGPSATPLLDALEEREAQVARQAKLIQAAEAQLAQARETIERVEALLTNLQPHIPQACATIREAKFIDNYVDPALDSLRAFLAQGEKP